MKYNKEILEKMILVDNLSYEHIGRIYEVSGTYIKKIAKKLNINLPIRAIFPIDFEPSTKNRGKYDNCLYCGKRIKCVIHSQRKYCNSQCCGKHKAAKRYDYYLNNQDEFKNIIIQTKFLKPHILKEQNNCCDICGHENIWNKKLIIFILDHINGDASNNLRNNLRLICPNCDSQLDTFKSKNKNSARKTRYLKTHIST